MCDIDVHALRAGQRLAAALSGAFDQVEAVLADHDWRDLARRTTDVYVLARANMGIGPTDASLGPAADKAGLNAAHAYERATSWRKARPPGC